MLSALAALLPADVPTITLLAMGSISLVTFLHAFLVLWTLRDLMLRTTSFLAMICGVLVVAVVPVAGFCLYVLLRPSQTLVQRQLMAKINALLPSEQSA